jgi:hypothetical protein
MGYEATSTLTIDGRTFGGTARLEHKDLIFRGEMRLTVPLSQIDKVECRGGGLIIAFDGRRAVVEIGAAAVKWADRIAHPPSRIEKLGVKAGMRVAVINLSDDQLVQEVVSRQARVQTGGWGADLDIIFLGVKTPGDLGRLGTAIGRLNPSGAIWVIRRKGKAAAVTEAESMAAGKRAGLVDVKVVSFSDTETAEKYVLPRSSRALVRSRPRATAPALPRRRGSAP